MKRKAARWAVFLFPPLLAFFRTGFTLEAAVNLFKRKRVSMYLIRGAFMQEQMLSETTSRHVNLKDCLLETTYLGVIRSDGTLKGFVGHMSDRHGVSDLSDVHVTDTEIRFTKVYVNRPELIFFRFKDRNGPAWIGDYAGEGVGTGICLLFIQEVSEKSLDLDYARKVTGISLCKPQPAIVLCS